VEVPVADWKRVLVALILHDQSTVGAMVARTPGATGPTTDARTRELSRLGALCASGASSAAYADVVQRALSAGVTPDEVVGTLLDVGPIIGTARLVPAASRVARALDFDVDAQLESLDEA
jgi:alkylhydroperoxidase/carboxymuconolactone decarboxylase family protein YurZ